MVPEKFTGDFSVVLRIRNQPDRSEKPSVAVTMRIDKDKKLPNTMNMLPKSYQEDDLVFRTASGETLGYQDKVRISGKMYFPSSTASVDFVCGLDNPYIEKAG